MDFIKVIHPTTSLVKKHDTVFLRDLFKGEDKQVLTAAECTGAFPVCGLALTDKAAAICPSAGFKTCSDESVVFLTSSSGCTKHASCPMKSLHEMTGLDTDSNIILGVFLSCAGVLLIACGFMWGKKRAAARASPGGLAAGGASMH
jgi:hypothetical protein